MTNCDLAFAKFIQNGFIVNLFTGLLAARSAELVSQLEASGMYEHLSMPWVRFIAEATAVKAHYSVQHADLFVTTWVLSQPAFDFEVKGLAKLLLVPVELQPTSEGCEVIAVHNYGD